MNLLYISGYKFQQINGKTFSPPAYDISFWEKYLDVFETIRILGEKISNEDDQKSLIELNDSRLSIRIIPANTRPKDLVNDKEVKKALEYEISRAEAILIKQASRKGNMAIQLAEKMNKPYMIELTADLNAELRISKNILKRLYRPIIYNQVLKSIKNCEYGLYVTQEYLQKVYPIKGIQFGCTDSILLNVEKGILDKRLKKIENFDNNNVTIIGMIATYSSNRKGIDTAIKMMEQLSSYKFELHILGRGTEKDRIRWINYAKHHNVHDRLFFDSPVSSKEEIFSWIDNCDINILPSRAEGLPRCIIEALSRACPCVTSNVCGLPELVSEEMTHEPEDFMQLSKIIRNLIENKELMTRIAKRNFERSNEYIYEKINNKRKTFLESFKLFSIQKLYK